MPRFANYKCEECGELFDEPDEQILHTLIPPCGKKPEQWRWIRYTFCPHCGSQEFYDYDGEDDEEEEDDE